MVVIRLLGVRYELNDISRSEYLYVKRYMPDAFKGEGIILTTPNVTEAARFATVEKAMAFWGQQSKIKPLHRNGRPNCPLTAYEAVMITI